MKFLSTIIYFLSLGLVAMPGIVFQDFNENDIFCSGNKCQGTLSIERNCRCDAYCSVIHDCCGDSRYLETKSKHPHFSCRSFQDNNVYVIDGCKTSWRGPQAVSNNCTKPLNSNSDPMGSVPVFSHRTNLTYKNYYCAICNNDSQFISSWKFGLNCSVNVSQNFLRENAVYDASSNKWGFWRKIRNKWQFNSCDLNFLVPNETSKPVRFCDPAEVSSCPNRYKNDNVKYKCHCFLDPVVMNDVRYRNKYCALCNGVTNTNFTCMSILGRRRPPELEINFALLLDFDFSQGNCVGGIGETNCACGEVYDTYSRRCRQIVCGLPGMKLVNNRCVPE